MGTKFQHYPERVIYSFSSYGFTQTDILLLLKGLNFSLSLQKVKFENHLLRFQLLYSDAINDERKDDDALMHLKSNIKDVGLSYFRLDKKIPIVLKI